MYYDGLGVPKDYAQALVWYRKAAAQGYELAKTRIAEIEKHLNAQAAANREKIPPALQYRCWLETRPPTNNKVEDERRFQVCLHSNWKRLFGNTPFPGD